MVGVNLKNLPNNINLDTFKEFYINYSKEFKVAGTLLFFLILDKFLDFVLKKFFDSRLQNIPEEKVKKFRTLFNVLLGIKSVILWIIALLIILSIYKIKLTAILTGFGIIGVIVGLASQAIIADIISGIAIILDRFFYIGDRVKIGDIEGEVIDINLRRTLIKDDKGYIHSIPNSQIKLISKKE
jgi:small conductance mechanosensitive channel